MAYGTLGVAQSAIGAAAIFARFALQGAGPIAVSALRLAIAALAAIAIARGFARLPAARERTYAFAGLALAAHFAMWIASLEYASVAISTLLVTTTPLWTEAYDVVRLRRRPARPFVLALALGLTGVGLVAFQHGAGRPPVVGHGSLGAALALAGSVAIGVYLVVVRAATDASGTALGTWQVVARTYSWAALALILASAAAHQGPPPPAAAAAWGGIVAMALVSQLLGHTALNAALRDFTPSIVALTTLIEPVVAALLAALVFQETLGAQALVGGICVLAAVAIVLRAGHPTSLPGGEFG